jgi:hypothetical protein
MYMAATNETIGTATGRMSAAPLESFGGRVCHDPFEFIGVHGL